MLPPSESDNQPRKQGKDDYKALCGEEVVISGISGLFPNSENVSEFMDNLYNKVDMVTTAFTEYNHPETPKYVGKISGIRQFDAQFFKVTYNQATSLDPATRKMMETAYAAIYDAGLNPLVYKKKKLGVYTGTTASDASNILVFIDNAKNPFVISGSSKAMCSNRISYFLDSKALSINVDCGCASGMVCLENAYNDINTGICEAALVGGCQLCLHPVLSLNLNRAGVLCSDGKTKCFDKNADGYARSEAVSFLFLQKAKDAKRIYAEIFSIKSSYGLKTDAEFLPMRTQKEITSFLDNFYSEAGISPNDVEYIEANGTALPEGDANELQAISETFAKQTPVMVGCVKSNMGNSEPVSGLCGITKLCLAYHKGKLPANLYYDKPHDISSIQEGKVIILKENTPFNRRFSAINSFAFTGTNCHVLLKGHHVPKDVNRYACRIPRLVHVSGRQKEGVENIFTILKSEPMDPEVIGLLHNIYQIDTPGHTCRGYTVMDTNDKNETVMLSQEIEINQEGRRPLWLVFSGMGSQWAGMGAELMRIPIFASAIEKCRNVLEPKGINIVNIITTLDDTIFNNILNCFVGIAAVQIGLIDTLKAIGIVPDFFLGHSVGELGCAYIDGSFTAEETIIAAYYRGLVSIETDLIHGSMAAIGIGYKYLLPILPSSIDIACRNSSESCTISGPRDCVNTFVNVLKRKGTFAKEVPTGNIAYHSRYIEKAGPNFLKCLREVIRKPVLRSKKWISTSVPKQKWNDPIAKFSSAEYHQNNLLSPVYFEEAAMLIPPDAVVVEVAPRGLLQAILRRSRPECIHISLTRRAHSDPVKLLLENFGKLYLRGFNPKLDVLYPKIEFPVSSETPLMSHFTEWYHNEDWPIAMRDKGVKVVSPIRRLVISLIDDDHRYIAGHVIDDNILLPEATVLFILWETLAMYKGVHYEDLSVTFHDVNFYADVILNPDMPLKLQFMITKGNHYFEVTHNNSVVVSGYVEKILKPNFIEIEDYNTNKEKIVMNAEDIYSILRIKGYDFQDKFQSIISSSSEWNTAEIQWTGNWITFIDSLLQLNILSRNHQGVSAVKFIKYININVSFGKAANNHNANSLFAHIDNHNALTRCGGVEIKHIIFHDKPAKDQESDVLETISFIPHRITTQIDIKDALQINLQLVADNIFENVLNITEVLHPSKFRINTMIQQVAKSIPEVKINVHTVQTHELNTNIDTNLLVMHNFLNNLAFDDIYTYIDKNTYILSFEESNGYTEKNNYFNIITSTVLNKQILVLLKKPTIVANSIYISVSHNNKFTWISQMQYELQKNGRVILVSEKEYFSGIFGLVKKLKKQYYGKIAAIIIEDRQAASWDYEKNTYKNQLKNNLVFNIFKEGQWGSYYCLPIPKSTYAVKNIYLKPNFRGIDSLKWTEANSEANFINMVQVHFAGPSQKDTQILVSLIETKTKDLGMDFSGYDVKGNRVMGLISSGALSSIVEANSDLLWPVPESWSLEEAATVPLPYVQALYCLTIKSQLLQHHTVFVSGGGGALGQAVISICLGIGCTVYTCVGDIRKKRFLIKLFPHLKYENVGYSYDNSFLTSVISNTKTKHCDIVINCMTGLCREFGMKLVGPSGIFLDLSTYDMKNNKDFGMCYLMAAKHYIAVDLSAIFRPENTTERKLLQKAVTEGISKGLIKPLTNIVFSAKDVSKAFRFLSSCKHIGRVLINIKDSANTLRVQPRITIQSNGIYVVICDETDLGVQLADRLIKRGANNITLHIKKINGYLQTMITLWESHNVNVKIEAKMLNTEMSHAKFLKDEQEHGQVQGIFIVQGSSTADDFKQEDFIKNRKVISDVVLNLSLASKIYCPELRYFVIIARPSQNVVDEYTTSILQQVCERRTEVGLPSLLLRTASFNKTKITAKVILNALETSLEQKYNNILINNLVKNPCTDLIMKLLNIIGVAADIDDIDKKLTLNNLISNQVVIEEIRNVIKENKCIDFTAEAIKKMTVGSILNLNDLDNKLNNTKFDSGMGAFFNYINKDEMTATQVLLPIPTLCDSSVDEEDLDIHGTYLMLISGFEGHYRIFKSMCERLKIRAVVIQLSTNIGNRSTQETAFDIRQHIMKRFSMKSKFYLLGYSYGVNVALEVAALFEKDGLVGVVYCLDSSPDSLRIQLDSYLGYLSEDQLQNTIIQHLFFIMSGQTNERLIQNIENMNNWSEKIEICINYLKKAVSFSNDYCRDILDAAYQRITLAKTYEPDFKLESKLILIKGIPHPKAKGLSFDYGLSKYTEKAVKIYGLGSDFASATEDCEVPHIINGSLDPQLLEEFKRTNNCESYVIGKYTFK